MISAKNGGLQTPPTLHISQNQKLAKSPLPQVRFFLNVLVTNPLHPLVRNHILLHSNLLNTVHISGRNSAFRINFNMFKVMKQKKTENGGIFFLSNLVILKVFTEETLTVASIAQISVHVKVNLLRKPC